MYHMFPLHRLEPGARYNVQLAWNRHLEFVKELLAVPVLIPVALSARLPGAVAATVATPCL